MILGSFVEVAGRRELSVRPRPPHPKSLLTRCASFDRLSQLGKERVLARVQSVSELCGQMVEDGDTVHPLSLPTAPCAYAEY